MPRQALLWLVYRRMDIMPSHSVNGNSVQKPDLVEFTAHDRDAVSRLPIERDLSCGPSLMRFTAHDRRLLARYAVRDGQPFSLPYFAQNLINVKQDYGI